MLPLVFIAFLIPAIVLYRWNMRLRNKRAPLTSYSASTLSFVSTTPSRAPLDLMPKEMLETVFSFLDAKAISNSTGVSRYWYHLISSKRLKHTIIERTLSSLKATALHLELAIGREVKNEWLIHRYHPAHYPRRWLIEDAERWKIYEFKDYQSFVRLSDSFVADARFALRVRVIAYLETNKKWQLQVMDGWRGANMEILIHKRTNPHLADYFQAGRTYDIITSAPLLTAGQISAIHTIRPVDSAKLFSIPQAIYIARHVIGYVITCTVCYLLAQHLYSMIVRQFFWLPLHKALDCQQLKVPPIVHLFLALGGYGYLMQRIVAFKLVKFQWDVDAELNGGESILLLALALSVLGWIVPVYGWWLVHVLLAMQIPFELQVAFLHDQFKLVKPRLVYIIGCCVIVLTFILNSRWLTFFAYFNMKACLLHICFTFFTFGIARIFYVRFCKSADPNLYARSLSLKKWIHWSLPVKWWFFVMLIGMPLNNTSIHCVGHV